MAITALAGTGLPFVGGAVTGGFPQAPSLQTATTMDAANEANIFYGRIITEDGGSHTIDTTGSSSIGWRTGAVTFANGTTNLVVGLAAMNTTTGPAPRAVNVADVITFDVSRTYTSAAAPAANSWIETVPTSGTKTIANGDLVAMCVQMTARGGADSVIIQAAGSLATTLFAGCTSFAGAAYSNATRQPNCVITFSDGALGFFEGGYVASVSPTAQSYNTGSASVEYGNLLQFTVPVNVYGIRGTIQIGANADAELVLYSDPLGTPAAAKTVSIDANVVSITGSGGLYDCLFPSPYVLAANTPVAAILKPTTANNVAMSYKTFNASAHQKSDMLGASCYAVNRASGAFAAQNSSKDRFAIGLLVGAFSDGVSTSPAGKLVSVARGSPY